LFGEWHAFTVIGTTAEGLCPTWLRLQSIGSAGLPTCLGRFELCRERRAPDLLAKSKNAVYPGLRPNSSVLYSAT